MESLYIRKTLCLLCVIGLMSCATTNDLELIIPIQSYDEVMVDKSNLPLFVNVSSFAKTKSSQSEMVSLESLIDRTKAETATFENYKITQIPFRSNEDASYAILSSEVPTDVDYTKLSVIKLFLVETLDTVSLSINKSVVTMIPDQEYTSVYGNQDISFLDKSLFSGVCLFSGLDGTYKDVYIYNSRPLINADVISISDASMYDYKGYISVVSDIATKVIIDGDDDEDKSVTIDGSICIAYIDNDPPEIASDPELNFGSVDWVAVYSGGSGGGGGSGSSAGNNTGESYGDPGETENEESEEEDPVLDFDEDVMTYSVTLFAAPGGMVYGTGIYSANVFIACRAIPLDGYVFDQWRGAFKGRPSFFLTRVTSNVSSTAYFHKLIEENESQPCLDTLSGIANPLVEMELAPTSLYATNYKGSTYGMTRVDRNGNIKFHSGIDIAADVGTPIYAMTDGTISDYQYVTEQPELFDDSMWPIGYSGDTNGAGNRVHVDCVIEGKRVLIGYWHLAAGGSVATNPRTGRRFAPGDKIYQGELLGYTGKTGNAYNVAFPNLHLVVVDYDLRNTRQIRKYLNPENYINGQIDWDVNSGSDQILTETQIISINCHDYQDNHYQIGYFD